MTPKPGLTDGHNEKVLVANICLSRAGKSSCAATRKRATPLQEGGYKGASIGFL